MSYVVRRALAALAALIAVLVASTADAHTLGLSTGEYTARGASVVGSLGFARADVLVLAPSIDENKDGHVTAAELLGARPALRAAILDKIAIAQGGEPCKPTLVDEGLTEQDGVSLTARWDCRAVGATVLDFALADSLPGHRHIARVLGPDAREEILDAAHRTLTIPGDATTEVETERPPPEPRSSLAAFFRLGVEHILTGYDHLLFLFALVLVPTRRRALAVVVTAFSVAHSVTLALASLGVVCPSPRLVEPAIALSIAYVGLENLFVKSGDARWRITFPFGLVHGFGFAGALQALALPRGDIPGALVSFNVGVEAGQLAVLAVLYPLVEHLRRRAWLSPRGTRIASILVALVGGTWFVVRVVRG